MAGGYATSRYNVNKTIESNKQLAEYQYSKDLEMWNRANEYNSPEMQMQRLEKAKLNPNLVYGSGSVSGNAVPAQMPKYQAPSVKYEYANPVADLPSIISQYQNFQLGQAQIDNVRAQTKATEQGTVNKSIQQLLLEFEKEYGGDKSKFLQEYYRHMNDQLPARMLAETQIKEAQGSHAGDYWTEVNRKLRLANDLAQGQMEGKISGSASDAERKAQDALFAKYRAEFAKMGITNADDLTVRMLAKMLVSSGLSDNEIRGSLMGTDLLGGISKAVLSKGGSLMQGFRSKGVSTVPAFKGGPSQSNWEHVLRNLGRK